MLPVNYHLQLVTDHKLMSITNLPGIIERAVIGGVNIVQLRDKQANKNGLYILGLKLQALLTPLNIPLIVNDHVDVALAIDAAGVHIGQTDLPYSAARKLLGKQKIIGLTINTLEQAKQLGNCGADYFGISPIFLTQTKPELQQAIGMAGLKDLCHYLQAPAIAIGGINHTHVQQCYQAGAQGIAVVSAILDADDPKFAAQQFTQAMRAVS